MANTLLTHDMLVDKAQFNLKNALTFSRHVFTGYNKEFHSVGRFKKGSSVRVDLPNKYRVKDGATLDTVQTVETNTTVTVDEHKHVAWDLLETELTQDIEQFDKKHITPAIIELADAVDRIGMAEYVNIYNQVGTPGSTPSTFKVITDAMVRAANESWPRSPRIGVISPLAVGSLSDGELKNLFNPSMVDQLVRTGFQGRYGTFDFFMDQNVQAHTTGTRTVTGVTMNAGVSEGATQIVLAGLGGSQTITKGDILTIAATVGVNPVGGGAWENSEPRQFVATALATESSTTTVSVSPTIYSSAAGEDNLPYQSVVTLPQSGAAITMSGALSTAYPQNLLFHPDCFALTMVPFARPRSAGRSVDWAQASDEDIGLSITIASQFGIGAYSEKIRLDILFGWDTIRPELGLRMTG